MDHQSISCKELEYEFLRSLCDLAYSYKRTAESSGIGTQNIDRAIECLENITSSMDLTSEDFEIQF